MGSITEYPNGVSSFGIPVMGGGGIPATFGNVYFVDYRNGSNANNGKSPKVAKKTLSGAYAVCTTNNNDVILIDGDSAVVETAMIDWSKNRIHVYGCNGPPPMEGYGCGARVTMGVTTDTDDIAIIKNTGVRNTFTGIKFDSSNSLAESVYAFAEGGEYTRFNFCEFYKSTHLTAAASGNLAAEVLCNGDSSQWYCCTFGDLVNTRGTGGSCVRANVLFTRETITGKVARDCTFTECTFLVKAADTGVAFGYITTATDIERRLVFKRPLFINAKLGTANPADAIKSGAAQTEGWICFIEPSTFDASAHATASHGGYLTGGSAPVDSTTGIAGIINT